MPLARNPDERIARLVHLSDELIRDPESYERTSSSLSGQSRIHDARDNGKVGRWIFAIQLKEYAARQICLRSSQ